MAAISASHQKNSKGWRNCQHYPKSQERLAGFPRVLVHRDFQSQNIILRDGQAYLIDFQGMRPGLAEYDLASLLHDPYVRLTNSERAELLDFYRATAEVNDAEFLEKVRLCAMQRLMQALGAYGFLGLVKGRKDFLQHIPKAVRSLGEGRERNRQAKTAANLLDGLVDFCEAFPIRPN